MLMAVGVVLSVTVTTSITSTMGIVTQPTEDTGTSIKIEARPCSDFDVSICSTAR